MGVAEDVELVIRHGRKYLAGNVLRRNFARVHGLLRHGTRNFLAGGEVVLIHRIGAVALAVGNAGWHKVRAQHAAMQLLRNQPQILVERLRQADYRVLAHVVDTHVGRRQQPGHAGRVDDMALPGGFLCGGFEHHRGENAHPVDHSPQVDIQHPLPVAHRLLPQQPARAPHPGVVKYKVRGTPAGQNFSAQRIHGCGVTHIHLPRHDLRSPKLQRLCRSLRQRICLDVHQHQLHAGLGCNAHALQPKAGASPRQHSRLSRQSIQHRMSPCLFRCG